LQKIGGWTRLDKKFMKNSLRPFSKRSPVPVKFLPFFFGLRVGVKRSSLTLASTEAGGAGCSFVPESFTSNDRSSLCPVVVGDDVTPTTNGRTTKDIDSNELSPVVVLVPTDSDVGVVEDTST